MQIIAITNYNSQGLNYQFYTDANKTKVTGSIPWDEIHSIDVFKRDMMIYDLICMQIKTMDGTVFELDEEDVLWTDVVLQLPNYLKDCTPWAQWFQNVALPAFEINRITIFEV